MELLNKYKVECKEIEDKLKHLNEIIVKYQDRQRYLKHEIKILEGKQFQEKVKSIMLSNNITPQIKLVPPPNPFGITVQKYDATRLMMENKIYNMIPLNLVIWFCTLIRDKVQIMGIISLDSLIMTLRDMDIKYTIMVYELLNTSIFIHSYADALFRRMDDGNYEFIHIHVYDLVSKEKNEYNINTTFSKKDKQDITLQRLIKSTYLYNKIFLYIKKYEEGYLAIYIDSNRFSSDNMSSLYRIGKFDKNFNLDEL